MSATNATTTAMLGAWRFAVDETAAAPNQDIVLLQTFRQQKGGVQGIKRSSPTLPSVYSRGERLRHLQSQSAGRIIVAYYSC